MIECRNEGIVRILCWAGIISLVMFNYSTFLSYQAKASSAQSLKSTKVALIYAAPTFHDEVVSSVACTIKDEGYYVIAYVGSGLHVGTMTVPFSDKRRRSSESFYGKCVDRWISITEPIADYHLVDDPDLLVFVTYPMLKHNFVHDGEALQLLRHLQSQAASTSVVLITHRTAEALHETLPAVEALVPRNQLTFVFLGEHTQQSTAELMQSKGHPTVSLQHQGQRQGQGQQTIPLPSAPLADNANANPYRLAHFYPIVPLEYIGASRSPAEAQLSRAWTDFWAPELPAESADGWPMQTFSIQGNFGGKHAHRKDVKGTVECLQRLEDSGGAGGGGGGGADGDTSSSSSSSGSSKTPLRVSIDLIGHKTGDVPLPSLKHGTVRFVSDLAPVPYYAAIARTRFMIAAVGEEYMTGRATSSVPAALITRIPLVTSRRFLSIYPCLRDAKVHVSIARDTECASIEAAARLSAAEYAEAKAEIETCAATMYKQGRSLFGSLGEEARRRRTARARSRSGHTAASAAASAAAAYVPTEGFSSSGRSLREEPGLS